MLENVHGRRRRYNNCFEKSWDHSAYPIRDISPCGEVCMHALSAWNRLYEILALVEKFVCMLYQPGTGISQVKDLRWHICSE